MKKLKLLVIMCLVLSLLPMIINFWVIFKTSKKIYSEKVISKTYDIALVLGCSVLKNGNPSNMLRDRLNTAISLYKNNLAKKILISGDHTKTYSEVEVMNNYLIANGIEEKDILIDYEGYSTSESLLNYKENYNEKELIIVTQKYHLYRALYITDDLSLNAAGVHAELINYNGQVFREIREILARNKDYFVFEFLK